MKLVLVESPAKAKSINSYLGNDYKVIATVGHIRSLPKKGGDGVLPEKNFSLSWEIIDRAKKFISEIKEHLKKAEKLILATDPDREGEAISWHFLEIMREKKISISIPIQRVVFHEITKSAILKAIQEPREIDSKLVNASLARNALDYLIGFNLSPILWQKLPGARSAGRVQSVALKLICERENEIESFVSEEFWTIEANLLTDKEDILKAKLISWKDKKLEKFSINNQKIAQEVSKIIKNSKLIVSDFQEKKEFRNPRPPFTTSTLQQDANTKLGFSASRTMRSAQRLYEGLSIGKETTGLITYMRTDSVQISNQVINELSSMIIGSFGEKYCPEKPRIYKSKVANAQEAHEAIRPTQISRTPMSVKKYLNDDEYKLYELIWKRTISSQMSSAVLNKTSIDISTDGNIELANKVVLRANGSVIVFDGFLKVYSEKHNEKTSSDTEAQFLPKISKNENLIVKNVLNNQHFTQPPPRYTDASLIKKMEELGIGRPSTYASILDTIEKRGYVFKDGSRYAAEDRGRIVTIFLENYFNKYVEYSFTAELEKNLDEVSDGRLDWKELLNKFWQKFKLAIDNTSEIQRSEIIDTIDKNLEKFFFKVNKDGSVNRQCPTCSSGILSLKLGKFGSFIACSNYPKCKYTRQLADNNEDDKQILSDGEKILGKDPSTNENILLKKGPYGIYLQLGDSEKPKRSAIPKDFHIEKITIEKAVALLNLPRELGSPPGEAKSIFAGIGKFGPYLRFGTTFANLPADETVLTIGLNHANDIIQEKLSKSPPGKILGEHPNGGSIEIKSGRFGSYLQCKNLRASIPKSLNIDELNVEDAINLINEKGKVPKKRKSIKKSKK